MFWGDLSLVRGSWQDVFCALCINLFGVSHLIGRVLQKSSRLVKLLSIAPFYLVRQIVFPVHILALFISLPFLFLQWTSAAQIDSTDYLTSSNWVFLWTVACCALAGAAVLIWLLWRRRHRVRPQPWDVAASFTAFAVASAACATTTASNWFEQCVKVYGGTKQNLGDILLEALRGASSVGTAGTAVCKIVVISTPIEEKSVQGIGRYIALNEFVTDMTYFLAAGAVLVYVVVAIANLLLGRRDVAHAMFFVTTTCMVFVMVVAILLQLVDWVTRSVQFGAAVAANMSTPEVQAPVAGYLEAYWYELGFVIWLAVAAAGVAVAIAWRKTRRRGRAGGGPARSAEIIYERIIVSEIFQFTVIAATLVFIVAFIWSSQLQLLYKNWYSFPIPSKPLGAVFLGLLLVVVLSFKKLRLGLDIAMDVVNHFVQHPKHIFPVRQSISQRFYEVVDRLTGDEDRPHLLVIAHSQGTVITVDALMKDIWNDTRVKNGKALKDRVSGMTILTFGSPLTHVYQHYFPEDYAPFSTTTLQQLATNGNVEWLNIYRVDDFVGTVIAGPTDTFPRNIGIPIGKKGGGHFHYWEDDVLGAPAIRVHLPGADRPRNGATEC